MELDDIEPWLIFGVAILLGIALTVWQMWGNSGGGE